MIRRLITRAAGLAAWPMLFTLTATTFLLPTLENSFFPYRGEMQIFDQARSEGKLCFKMGFKKYRNHGSPKADVHLFVNGESNGSSYFYDAKTGLPWGVLRYAVAASDAPRVASLCTPLPPSVQPADTVVIEAVAYYPGLWGLWWLTSPFPSVISPGVP